MPKSQLRKHFINLRSNIQADEAKAASVNAADNFIKHINLRKVKTIAFYHPIKGELDPFPLLDKILQKKDTAFLRRIQIWLEGRKLLTPLPKLLSIRKSIIFSLPTVQNKDSHLLFHPWKPGDSLKSNALYPQLSEAEIQKEHIIPDIIIVPLVAFDEKCHRLGYGAGFYDRTIRQIREKKKRRKNSFPSPLIIGYAYECQKNESHLPVDAHDMPLDYVITEKCIYIKKDTA